MAIFSKEVEVIVESENQNWFGPERNVNKVILFGYHRCPHEKSVCDQASDGRVGVLNQFSYNFIDVGRQDMQKTLHVLVVVEGAVEPYWETVANRRVTYI